MTGSGQSGVSGFSCVLLHFSVPGHPPPRPTFARRFAGGVDLAPPPRIRPPREGGNTVLRGNSGDYWVPALAGMKALPWRGCLNRAGRYLSRIARFRQQTLRGMETDIVGKPTFHCKNGS